MFTEINGALQSLMVLRNLVEANKSLRNYNELIVAVSEVNAKLISAQSVALTSQEKQATLTQCVGELEKEVMELKNWDRENERYQLTDIAGGVFAYALKPGMENGEPHHYLCTNCFTKKEKSILQAEPPGPKIYRYNCPRCGSMFHVGEKRAQLRVS